MSEVVDVKQSIRLFTERGASLQEVAHTLHLAAVTMWEGHKKKILKDFIPPCKDGCWFCCCQHPSIFWYEGIAIAGYIKRFRPKAQDTSLHEKLEIAAANWMHYLLENDYFTIGSEYDYRGRNLYNLVTEYWKGKSWKESLCPFLEDKYCSIYDRRPMTCCMYHTLDKCPDPTKMSKAEYDAVSVNMLQIPVMQELSFKYELIFFQTTLKALPLPPLPLPASVLMGLAILNVGFDEVLRCWDFKRIETTEVL